MGERKERKRESGDRGGGRMNREGKERLTVR